MNKESCDENQIKSKIKDYYKKSIECLNINKIDEGLNYAFKINNITESKIKNHPLGVLYIEYGYILKDLLMTEKGISLLEENKNEIEKNVNDFSILYNLANGYLNYYALTNQKFRGSENILLTVKKYYYESLMKNKTNYLKSEALTNLGNLYDKTGRFFDALECYEESLKYNPNHGMTNCNKGMVLKKYALMMNNDLSLLYDAYLCFEKTLNDENITPIAKDSANREINKIKKYFDIESLKKEHKLNIKEDYKYDTEFEKFYHEFCMKNRLYINICDYCQKCDRSYGDVECIKKMTVKINVRFENDPYLILSSYLNQIKIDFASSRLYLILSQFPKNNLNFIHENITMIETYSYELNNINIQLLKDSFNNFYNILDKIAFFINEYFELGEKESNIYFKKIWYSKFNPKSSKKSIIREKLNINNPYLSALIDISEDLNWGNKKILKDIRNKITHKYLNIKLYNLDENKSSISPEELLKNTINLAKMVRNAIIYMLCLIEYEENKNKKDAFKMKALEVPNKFK